MYMHTKYRKRYLQRKSRYKSYLQSYLHETICNTDKVSRTLINMELRLMKKVLIEPKLIWRRLKKPAFYVSQRLSILQDIMFDTEQ